MLSVMLVQTRPTLVAFLSTLISATMIVALTGQVWPLAWVAADFASVAYRLARIREFYAGHISPARRRRRHARLMLAGVVWAALFGMGAGGAVATGVPALMILASINIAGAVGTMSMRNAGLPRFGILTMVAIIIPFDIGLTLAPGPHMGVVAVFVPLLSLSFLPIIYQNAQLLIRTFEAERALANLARIDPLTGLANRKSLDEAFDDFSVRRSEGAAADLAVLCLDLDGFKAVNDTFGHSAGDRLLKVIAERLSVATRHGDSIFRLGGDEFVCLLPGADADDVECISRRLIDAVSRQVELHAGQVVQVGVSIGGAALRSGDDALAAVIERADGALYAAKRAGKNQYVFCR